MMHVGTALQSCAPSTPESARRLAPCQHAQLAFSSQQTQCGPARRACRASSSDGASTSGTVSACLAPNASGSPVCKLLRHGTRAQRPLKLPRGFSSLRACQGQANADSLDRVSNLFVDTAFRSTPWAQEARESDSGRTAARILFVSESGVCRSVLAQALLRGALAARGLGEQVECEARGTRRALAAAPVPPRTGSRTLMLSLPAHPIIPGGEGGCPPGHSRALHFSRASMSRAALQPVSLTLLGS